MDRPSRRACHSGSGGGQAESGSQETRSDHLPEECHTESKTSVELGKLLQQLIKLKQHQWPEV
jgi:hypothetical protein